MQVLLIAVAVGIAFIIAYHTYGRWLGKHVFRLAAGAVCPSVKLEDGQDYVPTSKSVVFGHHFTSIAGTGPIVGPAIAVMWGWLPALLWVIFGSIFIGAVHDFGSLVVSLRNNGQTVGEIAGKLINRRVRFLFLLVLFLALTIVIAIFGLVIAAVFKQYPAAIFPCMIQIPIAVGIGVWLHRKGVGLLLPSTLALAVMYLTVVFGNDGVLGSLNAYLASLPVIGWVAILLIYSYIASVLPVWLLLQPRDYINSLQLISALGLIVAGLVVAAFIGGSPPVEGAERQPLEFAAPMVQWDPADAPLIFPFLFITIACGAISGFHCLVSSGTSSKQLKNEKDAQFVGFGSMLTEGFLATLVILACCAGLGLGVSGKIADFTYAVGYKAQNESFFISQRSQLTPLLDTEEVIKGHATRVAANPEGQRVIAVKEYNGAVVGMTAYASQYSSWNAANGLAAKVGAFVDGAANFLKAMGIPGGIAIALMGVLVASFAGTTLDTACRLQRYVVQELARVCLPRPGPRDCPQCGYDLSHNVSGTCPECGWEIEWATVGEASADSRLAGDAQRPGSGSAATGENAQETSPQRAAAPHPLNRVSTDLNPWNPLVWLTNKHGATIFAVLIGGLIAAMPAPGMGWSVDNAGKGGLILWPMFGATNQLLGGLAFLVITFYLWRRGRAIWFVALPLVFMLIMPAWAMTLQLKEWFAADLINYPLIAMAVATLLLEAWMLVEAVLLFPKVRAVLEPGGEPLPEAG